MKYVESGTNYSHSVGYEYDTRNNLTQIAESINGVKHTTSYTYSSDNLPLTTTNGSSQKSNSYDDLDRVAVSTTKHNGTGIISEEWYYEGYDSSHTSRLPNTHIISANGFSIYSGYGFDDNGNISFIESSYGYISYQYDSANQLIREDNEIIGKTKTWTYDAAGNIQERKEYPYTLGALGTPTYTAYYFYEEPFNQDYLSIYDNVGTIGYDNLGNPRYTYDYATDEETRYTWKHGRQLVSLSKGNTTWTYTYNADGLRTKKTDGTTTYNYVYNGSQLTQMTVGSNTLYISYDASGRPFTLNYNGAVYYYVLNMLGDVVGIANSAGTLVVRYFYDAWGYAESCTGALANTLGALNPLRYRSYVYDQETGLYYLQSRYYNPEIGRFINADAFVSTGQGFTGNNMFAYCGNNPINNIDPTGNCYYGANGQWCHDNWEYIGGYQRLPDPGYYQGTTESGKDVYIAPDTNYSTPSNGVKVVDNRDTNINLKTGEHDPSIQIRDSYRIRNVSEQNQILDFIDTYNTNNPSVYNWERSRTSLIKEWEIHNVVCWTGYAFDSTAHVDFNVDDEGKGYIIFFWERVIMR